MKNLLTILFIASTFIVSAQPRGKAKMMPLMTDGYYVNMRNDTVRGKVQMNPESETSFYKEFAFALAKVKKARVYNSMRAKSYGFDGRDFVAVNYDGEKIFLERLATGKLRFYEQKYYAIESGETVIVSAFYIKDFSPEGTAANLGDYKKLSNKFYKRVLKPYMIDQENVWEGLDKFNFNKDEVIQAISTYNEFHKYSN